MRRTSPISLSVFALFAMTVTASTPAQEASLELALHPRIILSRDSSAMYVIESKDDVDDDHWLARTVLASRHSGKLDWIDPVVEGASSRIYRAVEVETLGGFPIENMVWVPAGTFTMGSPTTEDGHFSDEAPQTIVTISQGFWMGTHEVTQEQYLGLMGENPSRWKLGGDVAVESVSWCDAVTFCERLTEREQMLDRLRDGYVYRLPTEAEWEYACRAGTTTRYNFGNDYAVANLYGKMSENALSVGQFRPNAFGLYDMHGNVSEWALDFYTPYPGGRVTDPVQRDGNLIHNARGGSWEFYSHTAIRSANRLSVEGVDDSIGFRVILAPQLDFDTAVWCGN